MKSFYFLWQEFRNVSDFMHYCRDEHVTHIYIWDRYVIDKFKYYGKPEIVVQKLIPDELYGWYTVVHLRSRRKHIDNEAFNLDGMEPL